MAYFVAILYAALGAAITNVEQGSCGGWFTSVADKLFAAQGTDSSNLPPTYTNHYDAAGTSISDSTAHISHPGGTFSAAFDFTAQQNAGGHNTSSCFAQDTEYRGPIIKKLGGGSITHPHACQGVCCHTDRCAFWTYYPKTYDCYLRDQTATQGKAVNQPAVSGPRTCVSPQEKLCYEIDVDYYGYDENKLESGSFKSAEECQLACKSSSVCHFWTWAVLQGNCYLKNKDALKGRRYLRGFVSGPRHCMVTATPPSWGPPPPPTKSCPDQCYELNTYYTEVVTVKPGSVSTPTACQHICQQEPTCQFFSYFPIEKKCALGATKGTVIPYSSTVSGPRFCPMRFCSEVEVEYYGRYISVTLPVSFETCDELCQAAPSCALVRFQEDRRACTLIQQARYAPGVTSGPRFCSTGGQHRLPMHSAPLDIVYAAPHRSTSCMQPGGAYTAHPLSVKMVNSSEECQVQCQADPRCKFCTYFPNTRTCHLQEVEGGKVVNAATVFGARSCFESAAAHCSWDGVEVYGKDIGMYSAQDAEACQLVCRSNNQCSFFVYTNASKVCLLRQKAVRALKMRSAPRFCGIPNDAVLIPRVKEPGKPGPDDNLPPSETDDELPEKPTVQKPDADKPRPPDVGKPTPPDAGRPTPPDVGKPTPPDVGKPTPPDVGKPTPPDVGKPTPPDVGKPTPPDVVKPTPPDVVKPTPPDVGKPTPPDVGKPTPPDVGKPTPPDVGKPTPPDTGKPSPPDVGKPTPPDTDKPKPPDTDKPTPPDAGRPTPPDVGKPTPPDVGKPTPPDAGTPTPPDVGKPSPPDVGKPSPPDVGKPSPPDVGKPTPPDVGKPTPPDVGKPTPPDVGKPTPPDVGKPSPPDVGKPSPPDTDKPKPPDADMPTPPDADKPTPPVINGGGTGAPKPEEDDLTKCLQAGYYYDSFVISYLSRSSARECQEQCRSVTSCGFFSFFRMTGRCHLHHSPGNKLRQKDAVSGPSDCSGTPKEDQCLVWGQYQGKPIPNLSSTNSSVQECHMACKGEQSCKYFSYIKQNSQCDMFGESSPITYSTSAVSGPRNCSSTEFNPCIAAGASYVSKDNIEVVDAEELVHCQAKCELQSFCRFYSYNISTKKCTLLASYTEQVKDKSGISGAVDCLSPSYDISCMWMGYTITPETQYKLVNSVQKCVSNCRKDPQCRHFSYMQKSKRCYLHETAGTLSQSEDTISGPAYCYRQFSQESCFTHSAMYLGALLLGKTKASADLCRKACQNHPQCRFFNYYEQLKACELLEYKTEIVHQDGVSCGWQSCDDFTPMTCNPQTCCNEGAKLMGVILSTASANTPKECYGPCIQNRRCTFTTFSSRSKKCTAKEVFEPSRESTTWPPSCEKDRLQGENKLWNIFIKEEIATLEPADQCRKRNFASKAPLLTASSTKTAGECRRMCQGNAFCNSLAFSEDLKMCLLYEANGQLKAEAGYTFESAWCDETTDDCSIENVAVRGPALVTPFKATLPRCREDGGKYGARAFTTFDSLTGLCTIGKFTEDLPAETVALMKPCPPDVIISFA